MAAKVVFVELIAQTKKFNQGLQKSDKALSKTRKKVAALGAAITAIGTVAVAVFIRSLDELLTKADEVGKVAQKLNVPVQFVNDMRHIFSLAGADPLIFQKVLHQMGVFMGEAKKDPLGGSAKEIESLGLNLKDFFALNPAEQFLAIRDAIDPTNIQDMSVAQKLLGGDAEHLRIVLGQTNAEIRQGIEDARKYGGGMTAAATDVGAAWGDMKTRVDLFKKSAGSALLEAVEPALRKIIGHMETLAAKLAKENNLATIAKVDTRSRRPSRSGSDSRHGRNNGRL